MPRILLVAVFALALTATGCGNRAPDAPIENVREKPTRLPAPPPPPPPPRAQ